MGYNSVADITDLFNRCCLPKSRNHAKFRQKVIDLDVNRKLTCDFLLAINSNFGRISATVFEILSLKLEDGLFSPPTLV